jgi:alpha-mannosidase
VIFMSVLRSPTDAWVLDEPEYYSCPDYDGARDAGHHEFYYSLIPHSGDFRAASIEKRGREVNNPLICRGLVGDDDGELPMNHSFVEISATDNVIVTAMKKADMDEGTIIRLAETGGLRGEAEINIDHVNDMATVDFLEQNPQELSGRFSVPPFKIITVRLEE